MTTVQALCLFGGMIVGCCIGPFVGLWLANRGAGKRLAKMRREAMEKDRDRWREQQLAAFPAEYRDQIKWW